MRHQNCSFCSSLKDYERGFQKSGEGTFLPRAAENPVVLYNLKPSSFELPGNPPFQVPSSRLLQLRQCPQCKTYYLYRTDYEFLWGGSEDEQILERLTDEQALFCIIKLEPSLVTGTTPFQPADFTTAALEESVFNALEKDKNYTIKKLENALASGDAEEMEGAMENLDDGTCSYLELIPVLKRIAGGSFYHFDDNGAGGFPRPDLNRERSFKGSALGAIENIKENAGFEAGSVTAGALKSNDTDLIQTTLEHLKAEGVCADKILIPILTKIARKDVYRRGYQTEYRLEEAAREVIQVIFKNYKRDETDEYCRLCETLQDDLKIDTKRGEHFPESFRKLRSDEGYFNSPFRRCPACGIFFKWIDLSPGNAASQYRKEQLIRLPAKTSQILETLFSNSPQTRIDPDDVADFLKSISLETLLPALRKHVYPAPHIIRSFIPHLLRRLEQTDDASIRELLNNYVSNETGRAQEILEAFRSADGQRNSSRFLELLRLCLTAAAKND